MALHTCYVYVFWKEGINSYEVLSNKVESKVLMSSHFLLLNAFSLTHFRNVATHFILYPYVISFALPVLLTACFLSPSRGLAAPY